MLPYIDKITPLDAARGVPSHVPALLIAGGQDQRATPEEQRLIARNIASHPRVVEFPNAGHLMAMASDPIGYRGLILGFIDHPAAAGPAPSATPPGSSARSRAAVGRP
jgi:pimeloyl-ACP methyl ester carboxylesterase